MNQGITRSGFSLVAVIIFLGVAAVLIGVLVPMAYRGAMEARERETRQELLDLNRALTLYYADVGRFPADSEGFGALNTDPGVAGWQGPYLAGNRESPLDEALSDAWGLPYVYDLNPTTTPPSIGEVIVVSGGIDRSVTVGSQGGIWQLDDPDTDDLWTLVSSLGVEQDNLMEVNRELEKVAAAAQIFFRDRRTYPDLVGDLLDDFLAGGVADRRTRDSWNTTYRLIPDNAANPPTLTILSSGSDRIDENGTGDDLSLTINSVVPGRRSTVYKLKLAQAIVDGDLSFAMSGDWPTDRINLNLDPVLDADGWQTPFEEKVSTRQVLSAGPDADYWTPEDNIPQIVPDDGGAPEGLVLVDGSIEMPKKNCYHIRFDMTNTTDAPITISEATITWAAPEAYYDRVEIGGTRVIWEKKNRVSSGQTKTFSQTITINPGQTVQVDIRDYFQGLNGPQKQNMGGIVVGVEFDDGTVITLQTPTCS